MPPFAWFVAYTAVAAYALVPYILGPLVVLGTIVLLGAPMLLYFCVEWVVPPLLALFLGLQARRSFLTSLVLGLPLIVVLSVASPTASSGSAGMGVVVPWLSLLPASKANSLPIVRERLVWWLGVFVLALLAGLLSRRIRSVEHDGI